MQIKIRNLRKNQSRIFSLSGFSSFDKINLLLFKSKTNFSQNFDVALERITKGLRH